MAEPLRDVESQGSPNATATNLAKLNSTTNSSDILVHKLERGCALTTPPSEPWSPRYYISLRGTENVQVVCGYGRI